MVKTELRSNKSFFKFSFVVLTTALTIIYTTDYLTFNPVNSSEDFDHKLCWMMGAAGISIVSGMLLVFLAFTFEERIKRRDKVLLGFMMFLIFFLFPLFLSGNLEGSGTIVLLLVFAFFAFIFSDWCLGRGRRYEVFLVFVVSVFLSSGAFGVELVLWNLFIPLLPDLLSLIPSSSWHQPAGLEYLKILTIFLSLIGMMVAFLWHVDSILDEK